MLVEAAQAYGVLRTLRPADGNIEMRQKFCLGRAQIASGQFLEAVTSLRESLAVDPNFACAHNALGVAQLRLGRMRDARNAFEQAARTAPEWALPMLQVGQMLLADGDAKRSASYFEKAVRLQPRSITNRWHLLRAYRLSGQDKDFESQLAETLSVDPNYPPVYLESGLYFKAKNDHTRALQAMDTYLLLAPNYADSSQVKDTANEIRKSLVDRR
jgi:Flp pilus assembly protein TadD